MKTREKKKNPKTKNRKKNQNRLLKLTSQSLFPVGTCPIVASSDTFIEGWGSAARYT